MNNDLLKTVWLGIMLGVLVITSPSWLLSGTQHRSSYDAPWVYPGNLPR